MAINLWKLGGQPASYNPLLGAVDGVKIFINTSADYVVTFKAYSPSSAVIRVSGNSNTYLDVVLTNEEKEYVVNFLSKETSLFIWDKLARHDIVINSIQVVEKPLPKLTINGIDGFTSGKWSIHPNAMVIDDETLELNATGITQRSGLIIKLIPNEKYTFSHSGQISNEFYYLIRENDSSGINIATTPTVNSIIFTAPSSGFIWLGTTNSNSGKFTFKRPMLNLGSIPAPYEPKRGERMVLPVAKKNLFDGIVELGKGLASANGGPITAVNWGYNVNYIPVKPNTNYKISYTGTGNVYPFEYGVANVYIGGSGSLKTSFKTSANTYFVRITWDNLSITNIQLEEGTVATPYEQYGVQVNPKPKVKAPKKNVFDNVTEDGYLNGADGSNLASTSIQRSKNFIQIKKNTQYSLNFDKGRIVFYDFNYVFISSITNVSSFVSPSNAVYMRFSTNYSDYFLGYLFQIEEGSTITPYEPYQLVLPKACTGLMMDGVSNYIQLPSMTMDSIEIDCLIDSVQPSGSNYCLMDARSGLVNGYVTSANGSSFDNMFVNGISQIEKKSTVIPKNERVKVLLQKSSQFTDDVNIFSSNNGAIPIKGILYGVKCYLNGQVIASYDFTNPNNIAGDKILNGTAKNLIPSFEDSRWVLHANFKVLGKDVGRLDATANWQNSDFICDVVPNTKVIFSVDGNPSVRIYDGETGSDTLLTAITKGIITPTNRKVLVRITNSTLGIGSYNFIKPQLYQLDGKEGTLYGSLVQLNKPVKRQLYAKR